MLLWALRGIFLLAVIGTATSLSLGIIDQVTEQTAQGLKPGPPTILQAVTPYLAFLGILAVGASILAIDLRLPNKDIKTLSAVYFGILLGLLFGYALHEALQPVIPEGWEWIAQPLRLLLILPSCYICVSTLVQTKDDFRFIIPYIEFSRQLKGGRPLVLDTSVIIDGRIADICETRILDCRLIVPHFVLLELQHVADSSDKLKRNRGRRGLDMLKKLQANTKIDLEVDEGELPELEGIREVDQQLVIYAKTVGGRVMTNDFNLNKTAQLQGVEVINLNEIANALKSVALPGEHMRVRLIKPGDQYGQGVGYLDDGTMVVAEQGRSLIGQEVDLTVTSVLQTPAGRMIFGRVEGSQEKSQSSPP